MPRAPMLARVPAGVWAASALFALVTVAWTLLAPLGQAPDEPAHVDVVLHLAAGHPYPDYDDRHPSAGILTAWFAFAPGGELGNRLTAESAPPRGDRRTFAEWGGDEPTASLNQIPQHPPLYYWATSAALRLERRVVPGASDASLEREWHLLRLGNALLLAPLPLLCWATARRAGASATAGLVAALIPLGIPQLAHIGGSVNNDNLLIVLSAVVAVLVAGVARGDDRLSTAGWIAVVTSLALLTKAFAFVLLPWIVAAYAWQAWSRRPALRRRLLALGVAVAPPTLVGSAWVGRNLVRHDRLLPSTLDAEFSRPVPGFDGGLIDEIQQWVPGLARSFWIDFGSYPSRPSGATLVVLSTVVVAAAAFGLLPRRADATRKRRALPPASSALLFSLVGVLLVVLLVKDFESFRVGGLHPFMQGRYLFGVVAPLATLVAVGVVRVLGRWGPAVVLGLASLGQGWVGVMALRNWWGPFDGSLADAARALVAWSPWSSIIVFVGAGLGVLAWVATAVLVGRPAAPPGETGATSTLATCR